jgi:two-component system OmpR family response regulator
MARVLCINNDQSEQSSISSLLATWGYEVRSVGTAERALEIMKYTPFDAVVIDDALPGSMSGVQICRELRTNSLGLGIIFLYARDRADRFLEAFSAGADDCIAKMPPEAEFRARLAALVRRASSQNAKKVLYGSIELEPVGRVVTVQGSRIELTPTQFRMLDYLLHNVGRAIGPSEFKRSIFRSEQSVDSSKLRVHIYELRRRLGSVGAMIESVRGKGYGVGLGMPEATEPMSGG